METKKRTQATDIAVIANKLIGKTFAYKGIGNMVYIVVVQALEPKGERYDADTRNLRRGWGRCCCKSCAAQLRENKKPGYNPKRVAINNVRRQCWTDCPETERYPFSYDGADFDQWGDCEFGIHD
jgi:hypothetical protein